MVGGGWMVGCGLWVVVGYPPPATLQGEVPDPIPSTEKPRKVRKARKKLAKSKNIQLGNKKTERPLTFR